ncbi:hypothetical protein [uncultured Oscillibacter sp.]|uniref:hypothetical protein n=1 Tax=uncultured Oscillibacter sp. TaxID=876091 RepID=UPI0026094E11|nr:hypothetical protein [uncultured Oscillibacter sp.]
MLGLVLTALTGTALAAQYTDGERTECGEDGAICHKTVSTAPASSARTEDPDGLIPLGDPSDLRWDPDDPGAALWETTGAFQQKVQIDYYQVGQPDALYRIERSYKAESILTSFSEKSFRYELYDPYTGECLMNLPSGDYYFTVQNKGDGIRYGDSDLVSSKDMPGGIFHYTAPGVQLAPPSQVRWSWPAVLWDDLRSKDERIYGYYIDYGYSPEHTQNGEDIEVIGGEVGGRGVESGHSDPSYIDMLSDEHGVGWYYFRVRALSENISQQRNSEWSAWSEGYHLSDASRKVLDSLDDIRRTAQPEEIRQRVQALDRMELESALEAENRAEEVLLSLEEALGGPALPKVTDPGLEKIFDTKKVSVSGASLNNITGTEPPVLNIGRVREPHDIREEMYSSILTVDFSMELSGVEGTHDLAVPVKVRLPIPETIDPYFLAILHYKADGSFEEITQCNIYRQDGQWYVSFVLTSFSDFALTERLDEGDGPVILLGQDGRYQVVRAPEGARLYLARYEGDRFRSLGELDALSGTLEGSGKLFLLDGESRPLCAAKDLRG